MLKKPIGRQDQYAAAYGGLNYIRFNSDDTVDVEPLPCRPETLTELEQRTLLLYTGQTREANTILERQSNGTADRMEVLRQMRDLATKMRLALTGDGDLDLFASLLHEGWELKRSLGFGISNDQINTWYDAARKAGATGGKLLGAGGGGFLLLVAPPGVIGQSVRLSTGPGNFHSILPGMAAGTSSFTIDSSPSLEITSCPLFREESKRCCWLGDWEPACVPSLTACPSAWFPFSTVPCWITGSTAWQRLGSTRPGSIPMLTPSK